MTWSVTAPAVMPAYLRPGGVRLAGLRVPGRAGARPAAPRRPLGGWRVRAVGAPTGAWAGAPTGASAARWRTGGLARTSSQERNRRSADQRAYGLVRPLAIGSINPGRDVLCILT